MTVSVQGASQVRAVEFGHTDEAQGAERRAPGVRLPQIEGAASEAEVREVLSRVTQRLAPMLEAITDPETAIMAVANLVESSGLQSNQAQAESARTTRQMHVQAQAEAARRAAEHEKTAGFWSVFAKIASYIAAAVGAVVGIVATAVTGPGGVALAAGVIGAVASGLSLAAQATTDILREVVASNPSLARNAGGVLALFASIAGVASAVLGIVANPSSVLGFVGNVGAIIGQLSNGTKQALEMAQQRLPEWASWLMMGLGAAGVAGGMVGMQQAAGAGSNVARSVQRGAQMALTTGRVIQGAATATAGGGEIASSVAGFHGTQERINARIHGHGARKAMEALAEIVDDLRELAASVQRQRARAFEILNTRERTSDHLVRNMVRA
jgi:hypothetical protein